MRLHLLILLFLLPFFSKAQQLIVPTDTTKQEIQAVPLTEIPSQAERLLQKINKDYQQKIYQSTIQDFQILSDTLKTTASELACLSDQVLDLDIPYFVLETAINRWNRFIPIVVKEETKLKTYSL